MIYTDSNLSIDITKPEGTEYVAVTRISGGNADGKIATITFRDDNTSGQVMSVVTFSYDVSGKFESYQES